MFDSTRKVNLIVFSEKEKKKMAGVRSLALPESDGLIAVQSKSLAWQELPRLYLWGCGEMQNFCGGVETRPALRFRDSWQPED